MIFLYPAWLLMAIPAGLLLWLFKCPSRMLNVMRIIIVVLILLAMAGISINLQSRHGTVVVIADQSRSMPANARQVQKETIDLIAAAMAADDKLAVVSFGQQSVIEHNGGGKFSGFVAEVGKDASNLANAMDTAVSLIPKDSRGRLLVLSDGRWTGRDPIAAASAAAARQIPIDYRLIERSAANDLAIYRIDAPDVVRPGEAFMVTIWVQSPFRQEVTCRFSRGGKVLNTSKRQISTGLTRFTFRDRAEKPGAVQYSFSVSAGPGDPVPENNHARFLLGVEGQKPLLCVTDAGRSAFADLLKAGKVEITAKAPGDCNWGLEDLAGYSGVILEDVSANNIGPTSMSNIAAWIRQAGGGLMMTGGKHSYGPGGYFKSELEPVMPVSMELRQEHRKLAIAIVVALDRSGSMTAPVGFGKTKMDLANIASAEVLDMLSPMDEFGVIAVDSSAHLIVDLDSVEVNASQRNRILGIQSMGGGIFVYEALLHAVDMIKDAQAQTKHIILFSDAADSEQPGQYKELLAECTKAGITVSVIGLGKPSDSDAPFLEDVALRGQGRCFFTESAEELPRLFAQDTFVVARSSFLEDDTPVRTTAGLISVLGRQFDMPMPIGGYNLCYLRDQASLGAVTIDEYQAPIVASWQVGVGRALCYTAQVDGPFTGNIASWNELGDFYSSMARWVAGEQSSLGPDMLLTQEVKDGSCTIKLYLDPERQGQPLTDLPDVVTLLGTPGKPPQTRKMSMRYIDADTLAAEFALDGTDTYLSTVNVAGHGPATLWPVCLPYSPEFQPASDDKGAPVMAKLASVTGGVERLSLPDIWGDIPKQKRMIYIGRWLLIAAVVLLLLEVFQRRTGLLATIPNIMRLRKKEREAETKVATAKVKTKRPKRPGKKTIQPEPKLTAKKAKEEPAESELLSAMSKARRKAKARTRKK